MKKLLITGCNGFLGQRLCAYYKEKYDVIAVGHQDLDICREDAVQSLFQEVRPESYSTQPPSLIQAILKTIPKSRIR